MPTINRCYIIVPASAQADANTLAAQTDPDDGTDTFSAVKLSSDGTSPPSHYAANTAILTDARTLVDAYEQVSFTAHLYGTEDKFGREGQVYYYDSGWSTQGQNDSLGSGSLETVVLNDIDLQKIIEDTI